MRCMHACIRFGGCARWSVCTRRRKIPWNKRTVHPVRCPYLRRRLGLVQFMHPLQPVPLFLFHRGGGGVRVLGSFWGRTVRLLRCSLCMFVRLPSAAVVHVLQFVPPVSRQCMLSFKYCWTTASAKEVNLKRAFERNQSSQADCPFRLTVHLRL